MNRLAGRVAIITGSALGIGAASAARLAQEGARVVLADINLSMAEEQARSLVDQGFEAVAHQVDISSESNIKDLYRFVLERYAKVDILHNNAANTIPSQTAGDMGVATMDVDLWDRAFSVTTRGTMLMIKHALGPMLEAGKGSIISTSSTGSLVGDLFLPAYASSKAAINTLTLYVAAQYGKRGIRANVISPGATLTPTFKAGNSPEQCAQIERHELTPYLGEPEDIAAVVAFLASDDARYVTGQNIVADGGYISHMPHVADSYHLFDASPDSRNV